jgi:hypothetical protein
MYSSKTTGIKGIIAAVHAAHLLVRDRPDSASSSSSWRQSSPTRKTSDSMALRFSLLIYAGDIRNDDLRCGLLVAGEVPDEHQYW